MRKFILRFRPDGRYEDMAGKLNEARSIMSDHGAQSNSSGVYSYEGLLWIQLEAESFESAARVCGVLADKMRLDKIKLKEYS